MSRKSLFHGAALSLVAFAAGLVLQCASDGPHGAREAGIVDALVSDLLGDGDGVGRRADAAGSAAPGRKVFTGTVDSSGALKVCATAWKDSDPPVATLWLEKPGGTGGYQSAELELESGCLITPVRSTSAGLAYRLVVVH